MPDAFFNHRDARQLARELLGKVVRHRVDGLWLSARIIETEAYYLEAGELRLARLHPQAPRPVRRMAAWSICLLRGGDQFNFSAGGLGNAVLIKSGYPWIDAPSVRGAGPQLQALNPDTQGRPRPPARLCAGQTLLCCALGLKVPDWDARRFDPRALFVEDVGESPQALISTARLGIPPGRDEHAPLRRPGVCRAARNPLRRGQQAGRDYHWVDQQGYAAAAGALRRQAGGPPSARPVAPLAGALRHGGAHFAVFALMRQRVQPLAPGVYRDQRQHAETVDQEQSRLAIGVLATGDVGGRQVVQHHVVPPVLR